MQIAFPSQIDPLIIRSWGCLGASWGRLGGVLAVAWASWGVLGVAMKSFGASWWRFGKGWGAFGGILGRLETLQDGLT